VLDWDDGAIGDIVFDGQHYLGVSQPEFLLQGAEKPDNRFNVITYATGWSIGETPDWITMTGASSGVAGIKGEVVFSVDENPDGQPRTGYIHVVAGRLDYAVTVTQREAVSAGVWIMNAREGHDIDELLFPVAPGTLEQSFFLQWFPAAAYVTGTATTGTGAGAEAFAYHASSDQPESTFSDAWGEKVFNIRPDVLTAEYIAAHPFIDRHSIVKFATGGMERSISLRQVCYNTVVDVKSYYVLGGGTHSFTVRSNTQWEIADVENNFGIENITLQSGGNNTTTGQKVEFTLVNDKTKDGQIAKIILIDPTSRMANVEVPIKGIACGLAGVEFTKQVGSKLYKTHAYGTGADQLCWMVQNSEENPSAAYATYWGTYTDRVNGYYYYPNNRSAACPAGWRLPVSGEITVMAAEVNANKSSKGIWWTDAEYGAFAGQCDIVEGGVAWYNWRGYAFWWGDGVYYSSVPNSGITSTSPNAGRYMTVRCVQQ
jgi:hypothetical protein